MEHPVILFDGVCNFCNFWINLIIKHDVKKQFKFASLQSNFALQVKDQYSLVNWPDSVALFSEHEFAFQSDAVLKICNRLGGIYKLACIAYLLPRSWRNTIYNWIARNRYAWFGRKESCMIPTPELRERFLD